MALGDLMVSRFSYATDVVSNHLDDVPNQEGLGFQTRARDSDSVGNDNGDATGAQFLCNVYLPQNTALLGDHHDAFEAYVHTGPSESGMVSKWRPKERMKTGSVALVLCLNISVDPEDVIKISPCARMECWIDPFSMVPQRALETIGNALKFQYERWQPRARYKIQLDPTVEEIKKLCISCRKSAKTERVLFHYNGHGVLKPTVNGEIWMLNKSYTMCIPLPISELDSWLKTPSIYVFDCSAAGIVVDAFMALNDGNASNKAGSTRDCILLAACEAHETLPQSSDYPADVFTSCLTTPIKMALRWFHKRSLLRDSITIAQIDRIPGRQNDRKTLLGELNWIFTAITDTIAWNVLPHDIFQRLFRQDLLVASLFRNFLLAERIMRSANCSPISHPILPPTHQHHMWDAWDMAAELCISQLPTLLDDPNAEFQPSPFFTEQLTAFEVWLDHGSVHKRPPEQLPIVLQVLLSQCHRFRAMVLLGKFLDIGPWAVDLALSVGIFPYVLKLLQTTTPELRHILVFIWTKILSVDKSCQVDLVKDGGHTYFIRFLDSNDSYPEQRAMAAFVLAVIADGHRRGQETCVEAGLIHLCLGYLKSSNQDTQTAPIFLQWVTLCLGKMWEDYSDAQLIGMQEDAPSILIFLLSEPHPEVRASAAFALGTLLDIGFDSCRDSVREDEFDNELRFKTEVDILSILLRMCSDGSPSVRFEVSVALARFAFCHSKQLKSFATAYKKPQSNSLLSSFSLVNIKGTTASEYLSPNQSMSYDAIIPSQIGALSRRSNDNPSIIRDGRVSTSSPLSAPGIMQGSPLSDASSLHSDTGTPSGFGGGVINHCRNMPLDNSLCSQCVSVMSALSKDPSPRVASLGRRVLSIIGIEQVPPRPVRSLRPGDSTVAFTAPRLAGLGRSSSWIDINTGQFPMAFRTPPVSPPRRSYLTGIRRVCSLEFRPHNLNATDSGLADPLLIAGGPYGGSEKSFLPQANIYNWSSGYFSKPLLNSADDSEDLSAGREKKEELALDLISKCQRNSVRKFGSQIAYCDTKFVGGTKAALMQPFSPIVIATDDNERIMVWNYEEATLLNSFDNHNFPDKGVSTLCLVNELDDSLLLVCSYDGSIRIWKDYTIKGTHKLVTAFSAIQGPKHGPQNVDAVVDWQQQSGYLFVAGEIPSIMLWDLDKEKLLNSIPSSSDCGISALSASHVHEGQFAAGFADGSVRLFDVRNPEMVVFAMRPHEQRSVGIGFQPGLDSIKIVSASTAGDIQLLDIRNCERPYQTISAHRGSLTALAVHRHAPLIASGSANQRIKVLNLEGNTLSTIQYHPNFMGQRIGPVRCLSFHPYQARLAAGAADAFLAIYADDTSNVG